MEIGKTLIFMGGVLIVLGVLYTVFSQNGGIPRFPGDIYIKRENMTFYFPIVTSIVLSIVLSVVFYILRNRL